MGWRINIEVNDVRSLSINRGLVDILKCFTCAFEGVRTPDALDITRADVDDFAIMAEVHWFASAGVSFCLSVTTRALIFDLNGRMREGRSCHARDRHTLPA